MSVAAKITPGDQPVSAGTTQLVEGAVSIAPGSNIALDIPPDSIAQLTRDGSDLVLHLKSGETVRIANFYGDPQQPSHLYLVEDGKLVSADLGAVASDGSVTTAYVPESIDAGFATAALAPAGGGIGGGGIAAIVGGVALAGGGAALAGGGGDDDNNGGGSGNPPPPVADTTPPAAAGDLAISNDGALLTGTAEAGATVRVDTDGDGTADTTATVGADGRFQVALDPPLTNGENVTVRVVDAAGNVSAPATVAAPDTTAPDAASDVEISPDGTSLTGSAEPGATVGVDTDGDGEPDVSVPVGEDGRFEVPLDPPLVDGETVTVIVTDPAGNDSLPTSVTAPDFTPPPAMPTIDPSNGTLLAGTADAGDTVTLTDGNGNPIGQVTADAEGNWSFTPATPLPDGTVVNAVASDATGQASPAASITIDGVAPAAPTIDPSNGTMVEGTAEAGATVTLTDGNGDPIGEATADADGNWSFTPAAPLADGTVIHATASDAAGNISAPATVTVDAVAPAAPVLQPTNGNEVTGTAEAGATVTLTDADGNAIGQAVADANGNWSIDPGAQIPDGTTIVATATDAAGNVSAPATAIVDASLPSTPTIDPSNGTVLTGEADAGSTVLLTDGNGNPIGQTVADGTGHWSFTPGTQLGDGTVVQAVAQNGVGALSGAAAITIDGVAPAVPTIELSNGTVLEGTAEAGATVTLTDGNGDPIGQVTADGNGNWSFTPLTPLADGTVVNAVASDAAGNASGPATVTVDSVAPAAPVIEPSNGAVFAGTAEAGATVTLTDGNGNPLGQAVADGNGDWSITPATPIADGVVVSAIATDATGNASTPASVTVDASLPTIPTIDPSNGSELTGTADAGNTVTLTDGNGDPIGQTVADGTGHWSFTPGAQLPDGTVVHAVATNGVGTDSAPATITVDGVAPAAPSIDVTNGETLTGMAEAGATVTLTDGNGDPIGQTVADGTGHWSFTPATPLAHNSVVNAVATDAAGNSSGPGTVTVDALAPGVPVIDPTSGATLTGTAESGATVTLTDGNGDPIAQVTADGAGNWSYTPGVALPHGTVVNAVATDAAGNDSAPGTATVDGQAPLAPANLVVAPDGTTLTGTAEANSQVRIVVDGDTNNPILAQVDGSGNFSVPLSPALVAGETLAVTAVDAAGNVSPPGSVFAPDLTPPTLTVAEAADGYVNAAEVGDGIQAHVALNPGTHVGDTITVTFSGQNGYELPVQHVVTQNDVNAGGVDITLTPPMGMADFPEGASTIVATINGGPASAPAAFTVDTVPPSAPLLSLVGNLLTISGEPNTVITVNGTIGGVSVSDTVTTDNSGVASLNPLTDFGIGFSLDQLLTAQLNAFGTDAAGNPSNVTTIGLGASMTQPVTIGDFGLDVSLNPLNPRFGFSANTEPGSTVRIEVVTPLGSAEIQPTVDGNGDFGLNLLSPTVLTDLGLNITDILNLGSNISFNLIATDANGNDSAVYGISLTPNGLSVNLGEIVVNGTSGDDLLSGADGSTETINAGDGADLIFDVGTGDTVDAGNGNDTIQINATNFADIDGGAGFDTLLFDGSIDLDYNGAGVGTLHGIERVNMGVGDPGGSLTITEAEVTAVTDGGNVLQITGDANDTLNIGGASNSGETQTIGGLVYDVWHLGGATLLVEQDSVQVVA